MVTASIHSHPAQETLTILEDPGTALADDDPHTCELPFLDADDHLVYFDVQSAEPGEFAVPGVVDREIYKPGTIEEFYWVYFKGDPRAGPTPGHPFDLPFNNSYTKFSLDMVREDDTSMVVQEIMSPTNSSPFWRGSAPFGKPSIYGMYIPPLGESCKYQYAGFMIYRWLVPEDLDANQIFQLKLTTDKPPTTHLSGNLRIQTTTAALTSTLPYCGISDGFISIAFAGILFLLLVSCTVSRLRRSAERIMLE